MVFGDAHLNPTCPAALCLVFLPNKLPLHTHTDDDQANTSQQSKEDITSKPQNHLMSLLHEVDWKVFGDIFLVDFFLTFSSYAYRSSFVLIIDEMFSASPTAIGYIISFQVRSAPIFCLAVDDIE